MKKILSVCIVLLSLLVIFSCATTTPAAEPAPESAPAPTPAPQPQPAAQPAQPAPAPAPVNPSDLILEGAQSYTVAQGDILSLIAAKFYGAGNMYYFPILALANKTIISDPDLIHPGRQLVIPDLQRNLNNAGTKATIKSTINDAAVYYDRKGESGAGNYLRQIAQSL
jgi:Tfp pilus assembly protein FimV